MKRQDFERWVQAYIACWTSNNPDEIGALFSKDCRYYTQAFREPWNGRQAIVRGWMQRADEQGDWDFDWRLVAVEGDSGVLEGVTTYHSQGTAYHNIWIIRLDEDGRCREFKESWVQKPEEEG